jgi:hypothetical protein
VNGDGVWMCGMCVFLLLLLGREVDGWRMDAT